MTKEDKQAIKFGIIGVIVLILLGTFWGSWYKVPVGTTTIETRFGKVVAVESNGMHLKMPFFTTLTTYDIRQRINKFKLVVGDKNSLPVLISVAVSWEFDKSQVENIFTNFGSPKLLGERVLSPTLQSVVKSGFGKYQYSDMIKNRLQITDSIKALISKKIAPYSLIVKDVHITDIQPPKQIREAIKRKEIQQEESKRAEYTLIQKRTEAQQKVVTANAEAEALLAKTKAEADAKKINANAEAYRVTVIAKAESNAIKLKTNTLGGAKAYIENNKIEKWNGRLPVTMLGSNTNTLLKLNK